MHFYSIFLSFPFGSSRVFTVTIFHIIFDSLLFVSLPNTWNWAKKWVWKWAKKWPKNGYREQPTLIIYHKEASENCRADSRDNGTSKKKLWSTKESPRWRRFLFYRDIHIKPISVVNKINDLQVIHQRIILSIFFKWQLDKSLHQWIQLGYYQITYDTTNLSLRKH